MRSDKAAQTQKSPCSVRNSPVPQSVACSHCGKELEVWTDDEEAVCSNCGLNMPRLILNDLTGAHLRPPLP